MKRIKHLPKVSFLILLLSTVAIAQGKLNTLGTFGPAANQLRIATYTENAEKVGVLGITVNDARVSTAFGANEWDSFVNLWKKAAQVDSKSWQFVGIFKETGTTDPTLLVVSAGPGVQFTMMTATGTLSFSLSRSDYDKFDVNVHQVGDYLAAH